MFDVVIDRNKLEIWVNTMGLVRLLLGLYCFEDVTNEKKYRLGSFCHK